MPVPVNEIWKLKTYITTAVSESSGEYTDRDHVIIESLMEIDNEYEISGKYFVPFTGKKHDYKIRINTNEEISFLSIDDKQIIS
jgi:hypothetical protein